VSADLATAISNKTGIDDEAIQSGENLLLTFTNIRNETGKGNDVFNQATQTITDMSVALGQDMKSSAIQVGKALNDPIKGVTALQRVGVSFTAAQKRADQDARSDRASHAGPAVDPARAQQGVRRVWRRRPRRSPRP
jgi:phage-related minor tail protein